MYSPAVCQSVNMRSDQEGQVLSLEDDQFLQKSLSSVMQKLDLHTLQEQVYRETEIQSFKDNEFEDNTLNGGKYLEKQGFSQYQHDNDNIFYDNNFNLQEKQGTLSQPRQVCDHGLAVTKAMGYSGSNQSFEGPSQSCDDYYNAMDVCNVTKTAENTSTNLNFINVLNSCANSFQLLNTESLPISVEALDEQTVLETSKEITKSNHLKPTKKNIINAKKKKIKVKTKSIIPVGLQSNNTVPSTILHNTSSKNLVKNERNCNIIKFVKEKCDFKIVNNKPKIFLKNPNISVFDLRKNVTDLFRFIYGKPEDVNKKKVKNLWVRKPDNWPDGIPFKKINHSARAHQNDLFKICEHLIDALCEKKAEFVNDICTGACTEEAEMIHREAGTNINAQVADADDDNELSHNCLPGLNCADSNLIANTNCFAQQRQAISPAIEYNILLRTSIPEQNYSLVNCNGRVILTEPSQLCSLSETQISSHFDQKTVPMYYFSEPITQLSSELASKQVQAPVVLLQVVNGLQSVIPSYAASTVNSGLSFNTTQQALPLTEPRLEPGLKPGFEPGLKPGSEPGFEPGLEPRREPGLEWEFPSGQMQMFQWSNMSSTPKTTQQASLLIGYAPSFQPIQKLNLPDGDTNQLSKAIEEASPFTNYNFVSELISDDDPPVRNPQLMDYIDSQMMYSHLR